MSSNPNRLLLFLGVCLGIGIAAGIAWALTAQRPGYLIGEDLGASIPERSLAQIFAADAWFTLVVGLMGLLVGILAWLWLHQLGWWVSVLAVVGAALMAVLAWQVGMLVSPGDFDQRLATAEPGDVVPIDLELRSLAALLVAPFAAITPVMLLSAWWPEDRDEETSELLEDAHAVAEEN